MRLHAKSFVLLGLVVLVVLGAAAVAWSLTRPPGATGVNCPPARPPKAGSPVPADGLSVTEQAHVRLPGHADTVSLGAMIANNTDKVAYRTEVTLRLVDAAGANSLWSEARTIPVIPPHGQAAVGAYARAPGGAAGLKVELSRTRWALADGQNLLFTPMGRAASTVWSLTSSPSPESGVALEPGFGAKASFSGPCRGLAAAGGAIVFRDGGGFIVGGYGYARSGRDLTCTRFVDGDADPDPTPRPTWSLDAYPAEADLLQTGLTPYCDLA